MITEFEVGKYYRYLEGKRGTCWNIYGKMDLLLDGKPRLCIKADSNDGALFEGMENNMTGIGTWSWESSMDDFELVGVNNDYKI